ncbi:hypothetical protein UK23_32630 [Lentzea aerocolonigenes]|uniref:Uncharacterized protein n=2 Tax=Lentzea aerocolonigenes TaxID=68170 RepID=A0A0F0GNQ3_LENAE|nr:hypothetical protein UK23_32630 [Lentzea aerocolonigenes]
MLLTKRFSGDRPGLDLLGIEKAAVPVTVVATDVLAQEAKPLPLLDEFVLRLLKAEVGGAVDIAAFLGLDQKLVDAVVADHFREGALVVGPALGQLTLTARGRRLADELESIRPIQKNFKLAFDRLTWSVADYEPRDLVTKSAAVNEGCVLLPAQRTTRIKAPDVTPAAVNSILKRNDRGRGGSIDVLDVIDVTPSMHRYLVVNLLIYGDQDRGEVETAIIVDGDHSDVHNTALGTLGGTDKLGFTVASAVSYTPLPPHLEAERVYPAPGTLFEENSPRVRGIQLFEHQAALMTALETAKDRLLISTDEATSSVVDSHFLAKLEQRLRARVRVDLVFSRCGREVQTELDRLARRYRRFRMHRPEGSATNTLVFDGNWVVSEFPWLSFRGAGLPFRDYQGTVVAVPEETDRAYVQGLAPFEP